MYTILSLCTVGDCQECIDMVAMAITKTVNCGDVAPGLSSVLALHTFDHDHVDINGADGGLRETLSFL